jgi:hypothetical protein
LCGAAIQLLQDAQKTARTKKHQSNQVNTDERPPISCIQALLQRVICIYIPVISRNNAQLWCIQDICHEFVKRWVCATAPDTGRTPDRLCAPAPTGQCVQGKGRTADIALAPPGYNRRLNRPSVC